MKQIKGILIDSNNRAIKEVLYSDLESIYKLINVRMIEIGVNLPNGDIIYVDEEGLLKDYTHGFYINFGLAGFKVVGCGLVVRYTKDSARSCKSTVNNIKDAVLFLNEN